MRSSSGRYGLSEDTDDDADEKLQLSSMLEEDEFITHLQRVRMTENANRRLSEKYICDSSSPIQSQSHLTPNLSRSCDRPLNRLIVFQSPSVETIGCVSEFESDTANEDVRHRRHSRGHKICELSFRNSKSPQR